jgi:hypothetical protein
MPFSFYVSNLEQNSYNLFGSNVSRKDSTKWSKNTLCSMNILVTVHELTLFHVRELFTVVYVVHLSKVKYNLSDFDVLKSKKISLGACLLNLFLQNPSRPIQQVTIYLCWVVVHDPFYIFNFAGPHSTIS